MNPHVLEAIRQDLASFADPGTEVEVTQQGAEWWQHRDVMKIRFVRGAARPLPDIVFGERTLTYTSFFASPAMADISALAESQVHLLPVPRHYVEAEGRLLDTDVTGPLTRVLAQCCTQDLPFSATRVTFLRGRAGAGKTYALRKLAAHEARRVYSKESSALFLYIDAQAKSLTRLDEAVAALLQDLRASFTYRALAALTRLGLIVPIIDGFDELIGTGGYAEAFNSLALFLSRLGGEGAVIASARSSFLELNTFRETASRYETTHLDFQITPVEALPWGRTQIREYIELSGSSSVLDSDSSAQALERMLGLLGPEGEQFLETPFYVSSLTELLRSGGTLARDKRPIPQVIEFFIERERAKIRGSEDRPIASADDHRRFLEMLAEEMWWQEARELDVETVKTLAELAVDTLDLTSKQRVTFVEKAATYAFLETRSRESRQFLAFTHDYYYSYFVAQFFIRAAGEEANLRQALSRGKVTPTIAEEVGLSVLDRSLPPTEMAEAITRRRVPALTREVNLENGGALLTGIIRACGARLAGARFGQALFLSSDFSTTQLQGVTFVDSELIRCDMRNARWVGVRFENSRMVEPLVSDPGTRFDGSELEVGTSLVGIVIVGRDGETVVHDPSRVRQHAEQLGALLPAAVLVPPLSDRARDLVQVLRKLIRFAARHFYLSEDDLTERHIAQGWQWKELYQLLREFNLLEEIHIQRRGPRGEVLRFTVPPLEIERGEGGESRHPAVAAFWRRVREIGD